MNLYYEHWEDLRALAIKITDERNLSYTQREDLIVEMMDHVERQEYKFDENKGIKFTTWAYRVMYNKMIDIMRKWKAEKKAYLKYSNMAPVEEVPYECPYGDAKEILESAKLGMNDKQLEFLKVYSETPGKRSIMLEKLCISKSTYTRRLNEIRALLKEEIK